MILLQAIAKLQSILLGSKNHISCFFWFIELTSWGVTWKPLSLSLCVGLQNEFLFPHLGAPFHSMMGAFDGIILHRNLIH